MALTSNKNVKVRALNNANFYSLPVSGSQHLYQSQLVVMQDSTQTLVAASDTTGITGVGVCVDDADNTSGASGDVRANVYTSGEISLTVTGTVQYGDPLYVNSDTKVAKSGSLATAGVFIGHCMEADSETSGNYWVRLDGPKKTGYTFPV